MEEVSVADAVRAWVAFNDEHRKHAGYWDDFDQEGGNRLAYGCAQCVQSRAFSVYRETPSILVAPHQH